MKQLAGCVASTGFRRSRRPALAARMAAVVLSSTLLSGVAPAAEPSDASPQAAPVKARWVTRKLQYTYQGFTAHYSCDGLQGEVTSILKKLGARDDLVVRPFGCTRLEGPEPFPGLNATFSVLVPAESADYGAADSKAESAGHSAARSKAGGTDQAAADSKVVMARWDTVTLQGSTPQRSDAPGCELIEDTKKKLLPLFTTQNVKFSTDCFPHAASISSARLTADVLRPVKTPAKTP